MPKVKLFSYTVEGGTAHRVGFLCPGCGEYHSLPTDKYNAGNEKCIWGFNGDFDSPTFTPSILMRTGHFVQGYKGDCWCTYQKEHPDEQCPRCVICHSFVREGSIQFLSDCTHPMAGNTVLLPEIT